MSDESLDFENLYFLPLVPERWGDFETLFGPRGCGGCWCMYWRLNRADFNRCSGEGNRQAMRALVEGGVVPGLLAYAVEPSDEDEELVYLGEFQTETGGKPVGWVSLAPREEFPALLRSRIRKPVDENPVWSLVCFFIARRYRNRGLTRALIRTAKIYAGLQGAKILEAYPVDPLGGRFSDDAAYTGIASSFRAAGFVEVARRSPKRPIMRYFYPPDPED